MEQFISDYIDEAMHEGQMKNDVWETTIHILLQQIHRLYTKKSNQIWQSKKNTVKQFGRIAVTTSISENLPVRSLIELSM